LQLLLSDLKWVYIQSVPEGDFERFLGEASLALEAQLSDPEILAVFQRLQDR
jgi:hypothetical protein